ncbi:MAG TPA: lysylphosphatidylglycerol synthase transmembrane domain-containing protein [Acidothermaceae bacterium]
MDGPPLTQRHGSPKTSAHHRRILALRVFVSVALLGFLLSKAGIHRLGRTLSDASIPWLLLGLGIGCAAKAAQVTQWHGLLRAVGLRRTWLRCARLDCAGNALDAALPTSIGGDIVRAFYAGVGIERVAAATSVVLRRVCNLPGLVLIMGCTTLADLPNAYAGRITPYAAIGAAGGAAIVAVFTTPLLPALLRSRWLRGPKLGSIASKIHDAISMVRGRQLVVASARGVQFWLLVSASQYCFMRGVGIHVPIVYAALVVTTVNAISLLPISVGGYGLREGAFSAFLAVHGFATAAQGVAVGVCLTAQTLLLGLLGLPLLISLRRQATEAVRAPIDLREVSVRESVA